LKKVLKKLALVEKTGVEFKASLIGGAARDCGNDERSE
jgi:hypothetical protein